MHTCMSYFHCSRNNNVVQLFKVGIKECLTVPTEVGDTMLYGSYFETAMEIRVQKPRCMGLEAIKTVWVSTVYELQECRGLWKTQ